MRFCVVHLLILLDRNQSQSVITNLFKQQQLQLFQCFLHFIGLLEKRKQKNIRYYKTTNNRHTNTGSV